VFVSFEGVDGSGKTTQARLLEKHLAGLGREVVATREPGGTELGEELRRLVLNGPGDGPVPRRRCSRRARQHVHRGDPGRRSTAAPGSVCDRFVDSSLAYQGIARGLGSTDVLELNLTVLEGCSRPDFVSRRRVHRRRPPAGRPGPDRAGGDGFQAGSGAPTPSSRRFPSGRALDAPAAGGDRRRSRRRVECLSFEPLIEQTRRSAAARALRDGPAHAYLFHGPAGVGKRRAALAFAGELLADSDRVGRLAHPDLYLLEPLGDMIRIDEVRELRRDLHMRPFEAERRVYLIFGAHLLNAEAADALLKDLEEPPPYAIVVLVADELGPLPETIRSRCQLVPFRRLSERAIRAEIDRRVPGLAPEQATAFARVAAGRLDRVERLLDPRRRRRRRSCSHRARRVHRPVFDPAAARRRCSRSPPSARRGERPREEALAARDLPDREAEQHVSARERGAEREEILLALEELAAWYRDLSWSRRAPSARSIHYDRSPSCRGRRPSACRRRARSRGVRGAWRTFEEFNVTPPLALEALFVRCAASSPRPLFRRNPDEGTLRRQRKFLAGSGLSRETAPCSRPRKESHDEASVPDDDRGRPGGDRVRRPGGCTRLEAGGAAGERLDDERREQDVRQRRGASRGRGQSGQRSSDGGTATDDGRRERHGDDSCRRHVDHLRCPRRRRPDPVRVGRGQGSSART
jgi:DNA polymerase-3 subunit delta'